jgi:hypothetical protein
VLYEFSALPQLIVRQRLAKPRGILKIVGPDFVRALGLERAKNACSIWVFKAERRAVWLRLHKLPLRAIRVLI